MEIYQNLRGTNTIFPGDISRLLQALHTSTRLCRRHSNKYKYLKHNIPAETAQIQTHLLEIAEDLFSGVVESKPWGFIHLFTAFGTMNDPQVGLDLWYKLSDENSKCSQTVRSPLVTGSIIELMNTADTPFENIKHLYKASKELGESYNLEQAMIGALIKHSMTTDALELFSHMIKTFTKEQYALARIHNRFVGDCEDLPTALSFFYEGIEGKTPYKANTHPSKVVSLMERIWNSESESDFNKLEKVWKAYISSLPAGTKEWMISSTVNCYFKAFVNHYPLPSAQAVEKLKDAIQYYIKTRVTISPAFLQTILSAVRPWGDREVVFTLINAFKVYNLDEGILSCRIILNSFENIEVEDRFIVERWTQLTKCLNHNELHTLDIMALLRACYDPSRELLFTEIFESLLMENKISNDVLIGISRALIFNKHLNHKKPYFDDLLRRNYIEMRDSGKQVSRFHPFEPIPQN